MPRRAADRLACVNLVWGGRVKESNRVGDLLERLRRFSPDVQPAYEGVPAYWLRASGLERMYGSAGSKRQKSRHLHRWSEELRACLGELDCDVTVVVGFTRFGTYALSRSHRGILILPSRDDERQAAAHVPLTSLGFPPKVLAGLIQLGTRTVGELLSLPSASLLERFGSDVHRIRGLAGGETWDPLVPLAPEEPIVEKLELLEPEANAVRLTFLAKRLLDPLLKRVERIYHSLSTLEITLTLDHAGFLTEQVKPAEPTRDQVQLIDLVRLRLEAIELPTGVVEMSLKAITVPHESEQLLFFNRNPRRDPDAARRAFARIRAEFGHGAVVYMALAEGHLPEASFTFVPVSLSKKKSNHREKKTALQKPTTPTLIRRMYTRPIPLQSRPVCGPRGCHIQGMDNEPFSTFQGPYIVSGGWWVKKVHREYYFALAESGTIMWVYYDRERRLWFVCGEVS